jgi:type IV pilus assembly protein PilA
MRALIAQRQDPEAGFTLTEVLVVILVVGILAAIAIPSFLNQRSRAIDAAAKTEASGAERALVIYEQDNNTYACGDSAACRLALGDIDRAIDSPTLAFSASGGSGDPTRKGYRVTATARQGRTFYVDQSPAGGPTDHGCDLNGAAEAGGCRVAAGDTAGRW